MFKKFFEKKLKIKKAVDEISPAYEFTNAIKFAQLALERESKKEDKIIILDFMLDVIREDLKTDLLTTIFYSKENFEKKIGILFPVSYYDEHGNKICLFAGKEKMVTVDLTKDCVLVLPWRRTSMKNTILNIFKNKFEFDKYNHKAHYFSHVDICYVHNGKHSIASGIVHKKGHIEASEWDVSRLFKHVYTDGRSWYNSHNNDKLDDLFDFRVGIIFELAKMKYKVEKDF